MIAHEEIAEAIEARLRSLRARLGPDVVGSFDALLARRGFLVRGKGADPFNPVGQPVVQLPLWVAELARRKGRTLDEDVVLDAVMSSVVGYLHVRVHDDYFDHRCEEPEAAMILAAALLVHHQTLLARRVPAHEPFWELFEQRWLDYGQAMRLESRLTRKDSEYTRDDYEKVLQQARPLVLGGAALLAISGLWELLAPLERFVSKITLSAQLFNDVSDADEDLRNGRFTWVVRHLGGLKGPEALRWQLFCGGGLDALVTEASVSAEAAAEAAREMEMHEAVRFVAQRKSLMTTRVQTAYLKLFGGLKQSRPARRR